MLRWKPGMTYVDLEREAISKTLVHFDGNRARTARALRISLSTVKNRIRSFGLTCAEKPPGRPKTGK